MTHTIRADFSCGCQARRSPALPGGPVNILAGAQPVEKTRMFGLAAHGDPLYSEHSRATGAAIDSREDSERGQQNETHSYPETITTRLRTLGSATLPRRSR